MEKKCEYCGAVFFARRVDKRYCSESCRQMAYIERNFKNVNSTFEPSIDVLNKSSEPSIDLDQNVNNFAEPSIDDSENKNNPLSEDSQNVKSSIDDLRGTANITTTKTSIDGFKGNNFDISEGNNRANNPSKDEYTKVKSRFIEDLAEISEDNIKKEMELGRLIFKCPYSKWVSIRFLCLVDRLLTVSEMKHIHINELKEICNAFTSILDASHFKYLPDSYPFTETIIELRRKLKRICSASRNNEVIKFRFETKNRKQIIVILYQLASFIQKKNFSELFRDLP